MPTLYAKTLQEVIDDTQRYCNDFRATGSDGYFWKWGEIRAYANNLLIDLVRRTGILKQTRTLILTEEVNVYDLPSDCIRPLRIVLNGLDGTVLLPMSMSDLDIQGCPASGKGCVYRFVRDTLGQKQIGVFYTPSATGSAPTGSAAGHGLLRSVTDEDGNKLTYDANSALRWVRGVPFTRSGSGNIVRELVSTKGNIQITYVRLPEEWTKIESYPDSEIPEYIHAKLKYGLAEYLIPPMLSRHPWMAAKLTRAQGKWKDTLEGLQRNTEHMGPMQSFSPA